MKKILIPIFILFTLSAYTFDLDAYWEIGEVKLGGVFQKKDPKASLDANITAFKFCFCDRDSGFNFSLSPLYFDSWSATNQKEKEENELSFDVLSLINLELSFNTLFKMSDADKFALNLFASAHCVDPIVRSRFQINAGLEFAITSELDVFEEHPLAPRAKLFSCRTGFRYTDRKAMFFFDIGFDLGAVFMAFTPKTDSWDEYKQKKEKEHIKEIEESEVKSKIED